jgi:hypothetical protein
MKYLKDCPPKKWDKICAAFKQLQTISLIQGTNVIQQDEDKSGPPVITNEFIYFNGIERQAHESFVLHRQLRLGFHFCKTARKPYDDYVVALLCLANHLSKDTWEFTSDGEAKEWGQGLQLAQLVLPSCKLPKSIKGVYELRKPEKTVYF